MPMMQIGVVGMPVHQGGVAVPMSMRLAGRVARSMLVFVVCVVMMPVLVLQGFVRVLVIVFLHQVKPKANAHEAACNGQLCRQRLAQHGDGKNSTCEGSEGEVSASARGSKMA